MMQFEKDEVIRFLIDNTPMTFDLKTNDLKYDNRSIYYKTYMYIKELQEEIKQLKKGK